MWNLFVFAVNGIFFHLAPRTFSSQNCTKGLKKGAKFKFEMTETPRCLLFELYAQSCTQISTRHLYLVTFGSFFIQQHKLSHHHHLTMARYNTRSRHSANGRGSSRRGSWLNHHRASFYRKQAELLSTADRGIRGSTKVS